MSLKQWNIIHGMAISAGLIIFHVTGSWWTLLILAFLSMILLWITQWYTISHLNPFGGYGNLITLFRFLLILFVSAISVSWPARITGLLFIIPVSLDGLDGYLARRMNQQSKFGALFDLETDSLFVALAGLMLWDRHIAGIWLLPAVYMRYIYIGALTVYEKLYNAERKMAILFGGFAMVAIFLSCLGLFGLASFITETRTREIGIRKAMGASGSTVIRMLSVDFTSWVLVAAIIGLPVAYVYLHHWLQNFAYRTKIHGWSFILASIMVLFIAQLSVIYQSWKASRKDPADVLKYE